MNVFIEGMTPIEVMAKLRAAEKQVLIEQEERRAEQERMSELEEELKRMRALLAERDSK